MDKQTVIQAEWIELGFEPLSYEDDNGWINFDDLPNDFDIQKLDATHLYGKCLVRPFSLKNIENNNGWIAINSEDDLPKETGYYWVINIGTNEPTIAYYDVGVSDIPHKENWKWHSHYQPIIKPLKPLY